MKDELKSFVDILRKHQTEEKAKNDFKAILENSARKRDNGYGASVTEGRGDQAVQKIILDRFGKAALEKKWQNVPLIQFTQGEYLLDLWREKPDKEIFCKQTLANQNIYMASGALKNLLWDNFIFYIVDLGSENKYWLRVTMMENYPENGLTSATKEQIERDIKKTGNKIDNIINMDVFVKEKNKDKLDYGNVAFDIENIKDLRSVQTYKEEISKLMQYYLINCLSYLNTSSHHTVEVKNSNPRNGAGSKTAIKKPWLRDDLKRIILIDPTKAPSYGCYGDRQTIDRRSPVPHSRRGHYRILKPTENRKEPLKVFVRPSWIGPIEWAYKNQTYRVVNQTQPQ